MLPNRCFPSNMRELLIDFRKLGLSDPVLRSIREMGFEAPTSVQEKAIPHLMQGRDLVAQALTGTGKTAAYCIPIV